jgi:hypothetical protein
MRRSARFVAVLLLALLGPLALSGTARAADDSITVGNGRLAARGALVTVTVTISCTPATDQWGTLRDHVMGSLTLSQSVRRGLITGSTAFFRNVLCNGTPQKLRIATVPSPQAFRRGAAVVSAQATDDAMSGAISLSTGPRVVWFA